MTGTSPSGVARTGGSPGGPAGTRCRLNGSYRSRGMVTAELAVGLPAVVLVLLLSLAVFDLSTAQLRVADAARGAARAAARGESANVVQRVVSEAAPRGSSVTVRHVGDVVRVSVRGGPLRLGRLVPMPVAPSATSVALDESALGDGRGTSP